MRQQDYIPRSDAEFALWHDTFRIAAASVGATLGLAAADLTAINTDNATWHAKISAAENAAATAQQTARDKQAARRVIEQNVRALARRMKSSPAYTAALGEKLGIIGAEARADLSNGKPTLKAKALPRGVVEIGFQKSQSDGVNLYGQRGEETGFTFLARDTQSPYVDNRPLLVAGKPEVRQYKAVYVVSDAETGQASDEVVVTCQP